MIRPHSSTDRARASGARDRGPIPLGGRPPIAQLAEQVPLKDKVSGSTPDGRINEK